MATRTPRRVVPPRLRGNEHPAMQGWLRMASSGWSVTPIEVTGDPALLELVVADTAWFFALCDWQARRPRNRLGVSWLRWRREERMLAAEQSRLVGIALAWRTNAMRDASD